jgi:hypothetical protein
MRNGSYIITRTGNTTVQLNEVSGQSGRSLRAWAPATRLWATWHPPLSPKINCVPRETLAHPIPITTRTLYFLHILFYKNFWEKLIAYFPLIRHNSPIAACVFVAAVTFLPNRCLATIGGFTYRHTDWWEGFMKYGVEMGSGAMVYIPSLIKIGSGTQKLMGG